MAKFFSAVNCVIFLNTRRVDNFYSLEFTRSESVMPVYSWRSQRFNDLANGQILVQGNLILNIKDADQIFKILDDEYEYINENEQNRDIAKSMEIAKSLLDGELNAMDTIRDPDSEKNFGEYEDPTVNIVSEEGLLARQSLVNSAIELARLRKNQMEVTSFAHINSSITGDVEGRKKTQDKIRNKRYTIEIQNNRNTETNVIEEVRFTGMANQIQAGSSQNIKYAFPFIAKEVI